MDERVVKATLGALLHDIGKVAYRSGSFSGKHSESGYHYLKDTVGIKDKDILDCVRYHHAAELRGADIETDSIAYVVYMADNISASADRRSSDQNEHGFDIMTPLQPVFNHFKGNDGNKYYSPFLLNETDGINYPINDKYPFTQGDYKKVMSDMTDHLKGMEWSRAYVDSLLEVLEADLSFIPSATSRQEVPDISLFDHVKLTAAMAGCLCLYAEANEKKDLKKMLFSGEKGIYEEDVFLLASLDISGIQSFIYTIHSQNALKTLRARSFYLEILMEHIIDELLERLGLSRSNRIYAGGGHCYLLLPNTQEAREIFEQFISEINTWFLEEYDNELYIAGGMSSCSAKALQNEPKGSYGEIFNRASIKIADNKMHRYSSAELIHLNRIREVDYSKECKVCRRLGNINEEGICEVCEKIRRLSNNILHDKFFVVSESEKDGLPFPGSRYLTAGNEEYAKQIQKEESSRIYAKNKRYTGKHLSTKLWVGDYATGSTFEEFASHAEGIDRIGVLRADVDDLGTAFVSGFNNEKNDDRFVTLSRTATLSRQLSIFFKYYINEILEKPSFRMIENTSNESKEGRKAAIVYSGGDDVFLVGAWDDVLEAAIDLHRELEKFSDKTLTISAGYGMYHSGYPVSVMAREVGQREDKAKAYPGKNAITVFDNRTYSWDELIEKVIIEKYRLIRYFFENNDERGKSFIYNMLDLIRRQEEDRINYARFVYFLSRMEPEENEEAEKRIHFRDFSGHMVQWVQDKRERSQLETAMMLYIYSIRETEETQE